MESDSLGTPTYRHHRYTWDKPVGNVHHRWELICPDGAVHFHVTILDEKYGDASARLEIHYREAPGICAVKPPAN